MILLRRAAGYLAARAGSIQAGSEGNRTAEQLRASEERFRQIAEIAGDSIWEVDASGLYLSMNPVVERVLGYRPDELIGKKHFYDLFPPDTREELTSIALETFARRETFRNHLRAHLRRDGQLAILEISGVPFLDATGNLLGYRGIARDVTEHMRARADLKAREEQFRALFEEAPIACIEIDRAGIVMRANHAAGEFLAVLPSSMVGQPIWRFVAPEEQERSRESIRQKMAGQKPLIPFTRDYTRADGTKVTGEIHDRLILDGSGQITGIRTNILDITARKQAEDGLRREQQFNRALLENMVDGVVACDAAGKLVLFNRTAREWHGAIELDIAPEQWAGYYTLYGGDGVTPMTRDDVPLMRALGGETCHNLAMAIRPTGQPTRYLLANCAPFFDTRGRKLGAVAIMHDITERKRAEDSLRESEKRFRIMADSCPTPMWVTDAEGEVQFVNRTYREFFGTTYEQVEGGKWQPLIHPDDAAQYMEVYLRAVREHTPFRAEARFRSADGAWRWADCYGNPRWSSSGEFLGHVGLTPDITERKQAEEAQRASEEKFRQLAESIREVFWMMDAASAEVLYVSPAYESIWGRTCESLYRDPMGWLKAVEPADREQAHSSFLRQMQGESLASEYRIRTPGGEVKWIRDRAFPVRDHAGAMTRVAGVAEDVTEGRQADEAARKAKEAAEAANRAKSEFLANMSHEIRTPMNGVIGMTGLLLDTELTAEQRQYTEIVRSSADSLLALINDILDFSKIEARKLDLEIVDFDLRASLEDASQLLAARAQEKRLELVCLIGPEVPTLLRGDPGRLRQILINLAGNAVKFTEQGKVTILARLEKDDESSVIIRFSVDDTGIGIPASRQADIFSPFTQVDGSTTRKYGGTGLGLSICRQLVELLGGEIGVESEAGKGSAFWFTAAFEKQPGSHLAATTGLQGVRVLVADSHETSRRQVIGMLRARGCRPSEADRSERALAMLHAGVGEGDPYRVALLDFDLPETNGEKLGGRILAQPELREISLILMKPAGLRHRQLCKDPGFAGCITKPPRAEQIDAWVKRALGSEKGCHACRTDGRCGSEICERRQERVLVAEDNIFNQQVALAILEKLGYRADAVANGKEALESLRRVPYDLVLMDCQMPVMNGYEAAARIRDPQSGVRNPNIPIVALTAHAMKGDRDKCLAAGMNDYVAKPVGPATLGAALKKWLSPKTWSDPAATQVFDEAALVERLMGDRDLARTVVHGFLEDIPRQLAALAAHVAAGDIDAAEHLAHAIKSAAATVSGNALKQAALQLELAGKAGDLCGMSAQLPGLDRQFQAAKQTMERMKGGTTS